MKYITSDRAFYRQLLTIAVPIGLTMLVSFGMSISDTVMLGSLSEVHLSAAALANQLGFIFMLFTFGVGGGSNVMIAQYWGKRDVDSIHRVMAIMYRALLIGGLIFTCVALLLSRQVMAVFTTDPRVIAEGARFLRIIAFSYFMMGISSTTLVMLRSVGAVRIALVVYISSLSMKIFLNWVLVFGNLGAPVLEIEGAAIATVAARLVELVIICVYMLKLEQKVRFKLKYLFLRKVGLMRDFAKNAGPVIINELVWGMGSATLAMIMGRISTEFVAANSILGAFSQLVTILNLGATNAAAAIIGNTIGAGEYAKARVYGTTFLCISLSLGVLSCVLMQLFKLPMLSLYNISDTALLYAGQIINVYSVLVIFQSATAMSLVGILRGGGDTRYALVLDVAFLWLVCIPLGFLTGLYLGWPVPLVFLVIRCDEFFKAIVAFFRIISGKWIHDVTRTGANS
ncbi:MAG: MATE family efflux transporter [Oscillospiraceae bacterium]|nr:MATE family efflux transporter [Oscillospiraceae bacterium]